MALLLDRLARLTARHWKRTLAIAIAGMIATGALASALGGEFADDFSVPGTPSQQAADTLQERFPAVAGDAATVVFAAEGAGTIRDPRREAAIAAALGRAGRLPDVSEVASPLGREGAGQVSRDERIAFAEVQYERKADEMGKEAFERLEAAVAPAREAGLEVSLRGQVVDVAQQQGAPLGELIGLAAAMLILTLVFRSVVAMGITLLASVLALVSGLMLLTIGAATTTIPSVAPTLAIMLGLGAGVDYALIVTARFRERLAAGDDPVTAAGHANATAGVSVITAGAIVVVAISGLLATGIPFVGRMGVATAVVIATVAVGAVALLPALLAAGARRLRPKPGADEEMPLSGRWAERVGRRPVPYAVVGALILLLLAVPVTQLRLGMPDDGNQTPGTTQRIAYDRIAEGFGPGVNATIQVVGAFDAADAPEAERALARLRREIAAEPGVAAATAPRVAPGGDAAVITVVPESAPQDEATADLVGRLRDAVVPGGVRGTPVAAQVGGITATLQDTSDRVASRLPVFIAVVVGLSLLLLILVFRSIWVPVISAAFNLLSVSAAYGVVVAVFQLGIGGGLLGVDGEVPIVAFVPLFMFALLFGLSMDYNVFLQSRIHEEHRRGVGAHASVVRGLAATGRVISAAGAIMVLVFLGFVFEDDVIIKMMGVGLATAILVDVLVVRLLLAPAVMFLLGDRAWWFPRRLGWLPQVHLEGEIPDAWDAAPGAAAAPPAPEREPAAMR
ncbi:MAG: MMPL family transporter [Solirubrobacteraceae bacterium]|nr:MMPL family transporter [Solirubrobacteraceae bacterium]